MSTLADYRSRCLSTRFWTYTKPGRVTFTVSGVTVSPTAGAVYNDSGSTAFTVISASITAGSGTVVATGTKDVASAPDTLTKVSGTGDATLSYSAAASASKVTLTLPSGTVKVICRGEDSEDPTTANNVSFTNSTTALAPVMNAKTTWPQPVSDNDKNKSGGDYFLYEPTATATPYLVVAFNGYATAEAVIYMNRKIAPDDLTTAFTEVYTYV